MSTRILLAVAFLFCAAPIAEAQAVWFDSIADTTSSSCVAGKQCPLLVLPGTQVNFCTGSGIGAVSTAGTVVTLLSGPSFAGASGPIQISGITYQIQTVVSSSILVLATSAGTQASATYSSLAGCLANPITTYTNAGAGTPCPTTAQLTPQLGGACLLTSDDQGNFGAWMLPFSGYYYLRVPATACSGNNCTTGPYPITVGASSGCPLGATCDANYATLALGCTAAGSGTLYVTRAWNNTPTQSLSCGIVNLGNGKIQAAAGSVVTFGGTVSCASYQQCFDMSSNSAASIVFIKPPDNINPVQFGADLLGVSNSRQATQDAINSVPGGSIHIYKGSYLWSGCSSTECILNDHSVSLDCEAGATIVISSAVSPSIDWYRVKGPSVGYVQSNCKMVPQSGTPGRCGLVLDATESAPGFNAISQFTIKHNYIGPAGRQALCGVYPTGSDGIFDGAINDHNTFVGGMDLQGLGDTVSVEDNQLTAGPGPANYGPGLTLRQVTGATTFSFRHNSVTACNGSVVIQQAAVAAFTGNIFEPTVGCAPGSQAALVYIDGPSLTPVDTVVFSENAFSTTPSTASYMVSLDHAKNVSFTGNTFGFGTNSQRALKTTVNTVNTMGSGNTLAPSGTQSLFFADASTTTVIDFTIGGAHVLCGAASASSGCNTQNGPQSLAPVVTTAGTALTWVSGDQFTQPATFTKIYIYVASIPTLFTIASCASSVACTLTATAGVNSGVQAYIPLGLSNSTIMQIGGSQSGPVLSVLGADGKLPFSIDQNGFTRLLRPGQIGVAFSSTPVWNLSLGDFGMSLTGNVVSSTTLTAPVVGQTYIIRICQTAGGNTFVPPATVKGFTTISAAAGSCTVQWFTCFDGVNLEAISPGQPH